MDHLLARVETLEHHTRRIERRLRWWRALACGLLVLAVLTWALPLGTAQEDVRGGLGLAHRLTSLEHKLRYLTVVTADDGPPEVRITGANLRIMNGLGRTDCGTEEEPIPDCPNGLGNLIVGYNETRESVENIRTGSHNVAVGKFLNFLRFGGLVIGVQNTISGDFASVISGANNTASGAGAVVSGGLQNSTSGFYAAVNGGFLNQAIGDGSVVSGGRSNTASGEESVISGGTGNEVSGRAAVVSGGQINTASGIWSVVSGGFNRTAAGEFDWVAGPLFADE